VQTIYIADLYDIPITTEMTFRQPSNGGWICFRIVLPCERERAETMRLLFPQAMTWHRRQEAVDAADAALHFTRSQCEETPCLSKQSVLPVEEDRGVSMASLEPNEEIASSIGGEARVFGNSFSPQPAMSDTLRLQDYSSQRRKRLP
jgi:hypothetical protein